MPIDTMLSRQPRADGRKTEVRFEVQPEEVAVLDGYCSATGKDRTQVMRALLSDWSDAKKHEAIMICRVSGVNPASPEADR